MIVITGKFVLAHLPKPVANPYWLQVSSWRNWWRSAANRDIGRVVVLKYDYVRRVVLFLN